MMFSRYIASRNDRIARILAGLVLIVVGVLAVVPAGDIIVAVGLGSLTAGAFDRCVFAPLMGMPFRGQGLRA